MNDFCTVADPEGLLQATVAAWGEGYTGTLLAALDRFLEAARRASRERALRPVQRTLERGLQKAFRGQGRAFIKRFEGLRHRFPLQEAPPAVYDADWEGFFDQAAGETFGMFRLPLEKGIRRALRAGALKTIADLEMEIRFDLKNPRAVAYLEAVGANLVKTNETTKQYIKTVITQGVDEGWSYDRMAKAITDRYREFAVGKPQLHIDSRAHGIAVTEAGNAYVEGNAIVARDLMAAGVELQKFWSTMRDQHVSELCRGNEEQGWIPFQQSFASGHMQPLGHPYCRCDLLTQRAGAAAVVPAGDPWRAATRAVSDPRQSFAVAQKLRGDIEGEAEALIAKHGVWRSEAAAKKEVMTTLGQKLETDPLFQEFLESPKGQKFVRFSRFGETDTEKVVSDLIQSWAGTSGDEDVLAIALQEAARREFGLEKWEWPANMAAKAAEYEEHIPALQRFVRAQYDLTQEYLQKKEVENVWLWRGMAVEEKEVPSMGLGSMDLRLQPMSSFGTNYETCLGFARSRGTEPISVMLGVEVPRERILSIPLTGFGCFGEQEFVILSGEGSGWVYANPGIEKLRTMGMKRLLNRIRFQQLGG